MANAQTFEDLFWSGVSERRRRVAVAVFKVVSQVPVDPRIVEKAARAMDIALDVKGVRRLVAFGREANMAAVDGTEFRPGPRKGSLSPISRFAGVVDLLLTILADPDLNPDNKLPEIASDLKQLKTAHDQYLADRAPTSPLETPAPIVVAPPADPRAELEASGRLVLGILSRFIAITPEQIRDAHKAFLRPQDLARTPPEAHFVCYRFQSRAGTVVKSFMAVKAPTPGFPASIFTHAFVEKTDGPVRLTRGLLIPGRELIYCVGAMKEHEALKVLVLKKPRGAVADLFTGLTLSVDGDRPIAARVLLRRSDVDHHSKANIGPATLTKVRDELGDELEKIRNRVDFGLEDTAPVYFNGGARAISQASMVEKVSELLRNSEGEPYFKSGDVEFNPAAGAFYTFNSALKAWSDDENK